MTMLVNKPFWDQHSNLLPQGMGVDRLNRSNAKALIGICMRVARWKLTVSFHERWSLRKKQKKTFRAFASHSKKLKDQLRTTCLPLANRVASSSDKRTHKAVGCCAVVLGKRSSFLSFPLPPPLSLSLSLYLSLSLSLFLFLFLSLALSYSLSSLSNTRLT